MNPLAALIAPLLAVLPVALSGSADGAGEVAGPAVAAGADVDADAGGTVVEPAWGAEAARQVRIEQRVIIRVSPGVVRRAPPDPRRAMLTPFPLFRSSPRTIERRTAQCMPVGAIAGVQPDGDRLLLFMRDQRILSTTLEKGCRARDFYSGFLVERTGDGMLCAGRDKLLARSGANCGMGKVRQVVILDDDE